MKDISTGLPKGKCYSLVQIIRAAVNASDAMGESVSLAEATYALDRAYAQGNPCEMLHDSHWEGLTEPYSEQTCSRGVELENKMMDRVVELYNSRWWEPSSLVYDASEREKLHYMAVSKVDADAIWARLWAILFDGEPASLKQFISSKHETDSGYVSALPDIEADTLRQYSSALLRTEV